MTAQKQPPREPPYRPPWYPNRSRYHNPWAVCESGLTFYEEWTRGLKDGELVRLIEASR